MSDLLSGWATIVADLQRSGKSLKNGQQFGVSRRTFLAFGAATPGFLTLAGCGSVVPPTPGKRPESHVRLIEREPVRGHKVLYVYDLDLRWTKVDDDEIEAKVPENERRLWVIDPRMFGPAPECKYKIIDDHSRFKKFSTRGGFFPGSRIKADFDVVITAGSAGPWNWDITIQINGLTLGDRHWPFEQWMRHKESTVKEKNRKRKPVEQKKTKVRQLKIRHRLDRTSTDGFWGITRGISSKLDDLGVYIEPDLNFYLDADWNFEFIADQDSAEPKLLASEDKVWRYIRLQSADAHYWAGKLTGKLSVETPKDLQDKDAASPCPDWVRDELTEPTGVMLMTFDRPVLGNEKNPLGAGKRDDPQPPLAAFYAEAPDRQDRFTVLDPRGALCAEVISYHLPKKSHRRRGKTGSVVIHCLSGASFARVRFDREKIPWLNHLDVEKWHSIRVQWPSQVELAFLAPIAKKQPPMPVPRGRLTAQGMDDARKNLEFRISANDGNSFKGEIRQICADMALAGADYAHIDFSAPPPEGREPLSRLLIAPDWIKISDLLLGDADLDAILFGNNRQTWRMRMDRAALHVMRADMNIDLEYRFRSVMATLCRQPDVLELRQEHDDARLAVWTAPQHLAEDALDLEDDFKNETVVDGGKYPRDIKKDFEVLESRLANRSRLVFNIPEKNKKSQRYSMPMTMEGLTAWSELEPAVANRALPQTATLIDQLAAVDIDKDDGSVYDTKTLRNNAGAYLCPPEDFDTAIEIPYRLILSPSNKSVWRTTPLFAPNDALVRPLWSAEIAQDRGDSSVRAIWSPDLKPEVLTKDGEAHPAYDNYAPWRTDKKTFFNTLPRSAHRHEIVLASSAFGLPALMGVSLVRYPADHPDPDKAGKVKYDQNEKPVTTRDKDGSIFPPPDWKVGGDRKFELTNKFHQDRDTGRKELFIEGFYVPNAIKTDAFSLTSLGGTVDLNGTWEPPSAYNNLWPALNVERWQHRAMLGRDAYVRVITKGFLFPLGMRASFIEIMERKFHNHPKFNHPVSVLVMRRYIQIAHPLKPYKATNQRYDGRGWPVDKVTMVTLETPNLVDPFDKNGPRDRRGNLRDILNLPGSFSGEAFWPKISQGVDDEGLFRFEVKLDGDDQILAVPLLFVNNTAVHNPQSMATVVDYYNQTLEDLSPFKNIALHGMRRRYADALKTGDTEFVSHQWRLKAVGRTISDELLETERTDPRNGTVVEHTYSMDSVMEGADQPPFYPFVEEARIQAQSIKSMTGSTTGVVDVAFHDLFIDHGFDNAEQDRAGGAKNPAEMYLRVVRNAPSLNFSQNGGASGGIAKPNSVVVALSRTHGLVGGKTVAETGSGANAIKLNAFGSGPRTPKASGRVTTSASASADFGDFNPLEAFVDAKFLGLDLADLLAAALFSTGAPKMIEEFLYEVAQEIPGLVQTLKKAINDFITTLDKNLNTAVPGTQGGVINWRTLYPNLGQRLDALNAALCELEATVGKPPVDPKKSKDPKVQAAVGKVVNAIKSLADELKRIADNPVPPIVTDSIRKLRNLAALAKDMPRALLNEVIAQLKNMAKDAERSLKAELKKEIEDLTGTLQTAFDAYKEQYEKEVFGIVDLVTNLTGNLENALTTAANAELLNYYNGLTDKDQDAVNYVFAALYGRPLMVEQTEFVETGPDGRPIYRITRVYEPFYLKDLERPDVGNLRDSLYDDFIGAPLLRFYNDLKELQRFKQDVLKQLTGTFLNAVKSATRMHELHALGADLEKVEDGLIKLCDDAIGKLSPALVAKSDELFKPLKDLDKHLGKVQKELDKPNTQKFLRKHDRRHAPGAYEAYTTLRDRLPQGRQRIAEILSEINKVQSEFGAACDKLKTQKRPSAELGEGINKLMRMRRDAITELEKLLTTLVDVAAVDLSLDESSSDTDEKNKDEGNEEDGWTSFPKLWNAIKKDVLGTHRQAGKVIEQISTIRRVNDLKPVIKTVKGLAKETIKNFKRYKNQIKEVERQADAHIAQLKKIPKNPKDSLKELRKLIKLLEDKPDRTRDEEIALILLKGLLAITLSEMKADDLGDALKEEILNGAVVYGTAAARQLNDLVERELAQLTMAGTVLAKKLRNQAVNQVLRYVHPAALALYSVHMFAKYGLTLLEKQIKDQPEEKKYLRLILRKEVYDQLEKLENLSSAPGHQEFIDDLKEIKIIAEKGVPMASLPDNGELPGDWDKALKAARTLEERWADGKNIGLIKVGGGLIDMVESLVTADIGELIDLKGLQNRLVDELKDELEKALLELIPSRLSLSYDWGTTLKPFPDSKPIFLVNKKSRFWNEQDKAFGKGKNKNNHFLIDVKGSVDVLSGDRDIQVKSFLRPFSIKLFPGFDALTINFKGAIFNANAQGSKFDIKVEDAEIGEKLEYIKRLAEMLNPDTGPYLDFTFAPPTVIAGFRLNLGTINLGGVAFINIALDVACLLPLDDRRALFRFGLSNRAKPFLISAPPYGGGGFVSIRMQAADLVGFSAGFETGAVVDISFGPLTGHGRVTSGVYIDKHAGQKVYITGFVQAYGECSIACFAVSTALGVSLTMVGSDMYGEAWYEFAFKVGFFKAKFQISVQYTLAGGENAPGGGANLHGRKRQLIAARRRLIARHETLTAELGRIDEQIKTSKNPGPLNVRQQEIQKSIWKAKANLKIVGTELDQVDTDIKVFEKSTNREVRREQTRPIDGVQYYYGEGFFKKKPNSDEEEPHLERRDIKRISNDRAIREDDRVIVARVHDRSDWERYRELFD